jgi:ubiquinone/menaquinone biosynthesis C-methylase UbiE
MLELPIGGRLLDAGGGTGRVSKPLRSLVGQLVVIDASYAMLRVARDKGGTNPVRADAALLPFGDRSQLKFQEVLCALCELCGASF